MGVELKLETIAGALVNWARYIRTPLVACDEAMATLRSNEEKIGRAIGIYFQSFVLGLATALAIYYSAGLGLGNVGFHFSVFVLQWLLLFIVVTIMHLGLRCAGIQSAFPDTLLMYAICVCCYSPIFAVLSYPSSIAFLSAMKDAKADSPEFFDAILNIEPEALINPLTQVENIVDLVALIPAVIFAEAIARRYGASRPRVLSSLSVSIAVGVLPIIAAMGLLYTFVVFSFMGASGSE
jgi:hypothetical protein